MVLKCLGNGPLGGSSVSLKGNNNLIWRYSLPYPILFVSNGLIIVSRVMQHTGS